MTPTTETQPFDMVVVGASGDLAHRKLVPSLYHLHKEGHLPEVGRILAVARHRWTPEEFLERVEASSREFLGDDFNAEDWSSFAQRIEYLAMAATDGSTYGVLSERLASAPERARIFYLATPPGLYGDISRTIHEVGLITDNTRIVIEKPIGRDLASAQAINDAVGRVFKEHQIYRIDHYLGKETVQNLMAIRFGNALFEPLWRSEHVDHVQITVAETLGMGGRGPYYDQAGALRDMVQNHLLQLLCLVAMEPAPRLEPDAIRAEKIKVLKALKPITAADVKSDTVRGQYRAGAVDSEAVPGYLEEDDVPSESMTETFVALKAEINNWRWAGVPFYLRTGKRMALKLSEIVIQFRRVPHLLFADQAGTLDDNRLVIRLQPDESIRLGLMMKETGPRMKLRKRALDLNLAGRGADRMPDAYERLLLDVIRGVATLFIHRDEVEEAWRWIEPIHGGWAETGERPRVYNAGTWGPPRSIALIAKGQRDWYEHIVEPKAKGR